MNKQSGVYVKEESLILQQENSLQRLFWQDPIDLKKWPINLEDSKFSPGFNYLILFLFLSFWAGILGGVWFAYRGRFVFGTFIWPMISVFITSLVTALFALPTLLNLPYATSLFWLGNVPRGVSQFILAVVVHYIYSRWLTKQIKAGKYKQETPLSKIKGAFSLVILLFVIFPLLCKLFELNGMSLAFF